MIDREVVIDSIAKLLFELGITTEQFDKWTSDNSINLILNYDNNSITIIKDNNT